MDLGATIIKHVQSQAIVDELVWVGAKVFAKGWKRLTKLRVAVGKLSLPESWCSVFGSGGPTGVAGGPTACFGPGGPTAPVGGPTGGIGAGRSDRSAGGPTDSSGCAQFLSGFEMKISIPVDSSDQNAQKSQE